MSQVSKHAFARTTASEHLNNHITHLKLSTVTYNHTHFYVSTRYFLPSRTTSSSSSMVAYTCSLNRPSSRSFHRPKVLAHRKDDAPVSHHSEETIEGISMGIERGDFETSNSRLLCRNENRPWQRTHVRNPHLRVYRCSKRNQETPRRRCSNKG
jgi:hypothetical protein